MSNDKTIRVDFSMCKVEKVTEKAYVISTGKYDSRYKSCMTALPKSLAKYVKLKEVTLEITNQKIYSNLVADVPIWWYDKLKKEHEYLYHLTETI